mmetsp:Transcript_148200/g.475978  ORF Transcript_148200/g.475978 Transcript_148200/m.475978 type:complete len:203 (-) Transcript_148200:243-851(-)
MGGWVSRSSGPSPSTWVSRAPRPSGPRSSAPYACRAARVPSRSPRMPIASSFWSTTRRRAAGTARTRNYGGCSRMARRPRGPGRRRRLPGPCLRPHPRLRRPLDLPRWQLHPALPPSPPPRPLSPRPRPPPALPPVTAAAAVRPRPPRRRLSPRALSSCARSSMRWCRVEARGEVSAKRRCGALQSSRASMAPRQSGPRSSR